MQTLFNIGTPDFKGSTTCLTKDELFLSVEDEQISTLFATLKYFKFQN